MPIYNIRELLAFPPGDNATETIINNVHFNVTALNLYNYTLYSNNTLSNGSNCWLAFGPLQASMMANGTFINGTSCYDPYFGISSRGGLGIMFACLFGLSIMFTLINLRKHGRLFLPNEKRFAAVGRRWQWYWMLFVAACGMIGGITGIDVDRDYVLSLPIVLQSFFNYLMIPGILATVWEAVRHWGSWQERQIYDHDPFSLPQDDKRASREFYMPLVFYMFAWLNFFMIIPRSWTALEYQRSLQQQNALAKPSATDSRFKAGGFLAFLAWCTICYSLRHSIHHYKPRNRGQLNRFIGFLKYCPAKFLLTIALLLVVVLYDIASSFVWNVSPLKFDGGAGWMYGLGNTPIFLIIAIYEIWGYLDPNEDRALLKQRAERDRAVDAELRLAKKPSWWSKMSGDRHLTDEQRLKALTTEVGGGRATARKIERAIELGEMPPLSNPEDWNSDGENPFRDDGEAQLLGDRRRHTRAESTADSDDFSGRARSERTLSTIGSRPQQVRSMLDLYSTVSRSQATEKMQGLKALTTEVGGGRATARNIERAIELGEMPPPSNPEDWKSDGENPFRDGGEAQLLGDRRRHTRGESTADSDDFSGRARRERTLSTIGSRPQQVRSMLDLYSTGVR